MSADPFPERWIHGSPSAKHDTDPLIQVHAFDERTFILRQNMAVNYEAPFMFVLVGRERALLVDTGATRQARYSPIRSVVDGLIGATPLVVMHSHSHGDHVAGDRQFKDRPATTVVRARVWEVSRFLGLEHWPDGVGTIDLGDRLVDVIPSPGHDTAAVTFYDRATGLLLTGDTVYPGRLYVWDRRTFSATIDRLVAFAETHPVSYVLGCHIEMTRTPGQDYKIRTTYQPDEARLEMSVDQLRAVRAAVASIGGRPGTHVFDDFIVYNGVPDGYFG